MVRTDSEKGMDRPSGKRPRETKMMKAARPGAYLPAKTVKDIVREDPSVGRIATDATLLIARSVDAFLVDIVTASLKRSSASGEGKSSGKRRGSATQDVRRILSSDVERAVQQEERFDFLRPVLSSLDERKTAVEAGKRQPPRTRRKPTNAANGNRTSQHNLGSGSTTTGAGASRCKASSLGLSGGGLGTGAKFGGSLLAQAGLNAEEDMRGLTQELRGAGDRVCCDGEEEEEDDDDYDDC